MGNDFIGFYAGLFNTEGNLNIFLGRSAGWHNSTGSSNVMIGSGAGFSSYVGNNLVIIGNNADATDALDNSMALGNGANITASNQVRIGNIFVTSIGGYVAWSNLSDGRFKKNVKSDVKGLEFILKLKPVTYNLDLEKLNKFNGSEKSIDQKSDIVQSGFIAQDVEKVAKEINYNFSGVDKPKNEKDHYSLRYSEFVVPIVKAIQEQQEIIENQQKLINDLLKRIETLENK